ncbi:hypothetical protein ABT120_57810 [Nonomuraea angiospora]|uniref:hypothetical protein n=1 Tax=Nonomuraea angiospora TaxID=46172 RepID=UPI003333F964
MTKPAVAALAGLALLTAACGGTTSGPEQQGKPATGGTFTFAIPADPGVLDPATGVLTVTNNVLALAYDTLVSVDAAGGGAAAQRVIHAVEAVTSSSTSGIGAPPGSWPRLTSQGRAPSWPGPRSPLP